MAGFDVSLLNFFRWVGILGTMTFGVVTIWFFITAHRGLSVGFLFATILFGLVWRSWLSGSNVQIDPNPEAQEHEEKYLESGY